MQASSPPPFATATLIRLYLQQGHLDSAEAMLTELQRRGESGLEDLEAALWEARKQNSGMGSEPDPSIPHPYTPSSAALQRVPESLAPNTQAASSHPQSAKMTPLSQNPAPFRAGDEIPPSGTPESSIDALLRELLERIAQRRRRPKKLEV